MCVCGYSRSSASPPSTAAYQLPSCSLEHGQSQHGSPTWSCDCPTWLWVTSQAATRLGKPGPSCGCCKSSVGTWPCLAFHPDGGVGSAQGCGVCPCHQTRMERVMLSATRECLSLGDTHTQLCVNSDAEVWMFGWKSSSPASQGRAEQNHSVLSRPSPAHSSGSTGE